MRPFAVYGSICGLTLLAACSTKQADNSAAQPAPPPVAAADSAGPAPGPAAPATKPQVADSANLSPKFLQGLRGLGGAGTYSVRGQWLRMGQDDSVRFPLDLPAGKPVVYTGRQGAQTITLTLTRLNYTSLRFAADAVGGSTGPQHEEGVADLNPGFLLAAEVPEDTESQVSYGANEYLGETPTRNFSILVGIGPDADKAELSIVDATGKPLAQWQSVPTLRRPTL
ncbi:hypothetical protein [Hymenobacter chitinivorans]|uniref:Uncharacterized protein n=1 Tax=Hymenobacter chitinivorans DSM 11115 TaxID=1121954 RepID=A0A2M9BSH0_9BACT|nr:hypothetical protein [Hymenobacter chitinivorans]PJJ60895.1 hypothetical protein CLV45_2330 [Hymenobacter chitinivorans DSM 11115]